MGSEQQMAVATGFLAFQALVILAHLGISIFMAKRMGLRKRWGLLGFPVLVLTSQAFRLVAPALRFIEPLVTKMVQPFGQEGVVGVFIVTTLLVFAIALFVMWVALKFLKKKGFH